MSQAGQTTAPAGAVARPSAAPTDDATPARAGFAERDLVLGVAGVLVAAHVLLRTWMLWPSFFYGDDFALLGEASTPDRSAGDLLEPYGAQFMPLGRALSWVVADAGPLSWSSAALTVLGMVLVADLACAWMLVELFGRRWGVLLPLAAYLGTAVVVPATMWWAAALNQLPMQAVLFAAVAAWVRYLRTGRARWWVVTAALLAGGLLAYVKVLLVPVVLLWLVLAHFTAGGPWQRLGQAARAHRAPLVVVGGGGAAFAVWYALTVPSILTDADMPVAGDLAGTMLGQALPVGLLGGPWRWSSVSPPLMVADPPAWAVAAAWVLLGAGALALAARRRRTGRVWALLAAYAVLGYLLVLSTRSAVVGGSIGLEYRYLTDVAPVAVLCLGLATMTLRGAEEPTARRAGRAPAPLAVPLTAGAVLAASGLVSTVAYTQPWHTDHPAQAWFDQAGPALVTAEVVDLADEPAPADVVSPLAAPWNTLGRLLPLAGIDVSFPPVSSRLAHLTDSGQVVQAVVVAETSGAPGPVEGCGYQLRDDTVTIPLEREVPPGRSWMRIGYLSSAADDVTVTAGAVTGSAPVSKGLGSVFVDVGAGASSVTVGVDGATTLCVDDVQVGPLTGGRPW